MAIVLSRKRLLEILKIHISGVNNFSTKHAKSYRKPDLFPQRLYLPENHGYTPTLSPNQVCSLLSLNETGLVNSLNGTHVIRSYESNQLGANFPCEDRRGQARLLQTPGTMFGVYDGHGGMACSQAISERLFDYIATSLLPTDKLEQFIHALKTDAPMDLLAYHRNENDYVHDDMSGLYRNSLQKFVVETLSMSGLDEFDEDTAVRDALINAFTRLDNDISAEAMPIGGSVNLEAVEVAMSGSCGIMCHVDDLNLHVANLGDTRAVLGKVTNNGQWAAQALSVDHNTSNKEECQRITKAHPISEESSLIRNKRLLGQLIPLRAFGDFRYKWQLNDLKNLVNILDTSYAQTIIPPHYHTPPYLISTPEVTHHRLQTCDRFLVLASDGLWEMLSDETVVRLVGEYIEGKETTSSFRLPDLSMKLGSVNQMLQKRKSGLANKSVDNNVATHLIRYALGYEHRKVSEMLTLPPEVVRYYRDDITVTVIFFDPQYIEIKQDHV